MEVYPYHMFDESPLILNKVGLATVREGVGWAPLTPNQGSKAKRSNPYAQQNRIGTEEKPLADLQGER